MKDSLFVSTSEDINAICKEFAKCIKKVRLRSEAESQHQQQKQLQFSSEVNTEDPIVTKKNLHKVYLLWR